MGLIGDSAYGTDSTPDIIDTDINNAIRRHNDIDKWADQGGWVEVRGYYVSPLESASEEQRDITPKAFNIGDVYDVDLRLISVTSNLAIDTSDSRGIQLLVDKNSLLD